MRRWGIFLALLIGLFSFSTAGAASLKELLTKLENDLKNGQPQKVINEDIKKIKSMQEKLPVYYLPELNYLLKKEVEEVPNTKISLVKKLLFITKPIQQAFLALIFLLLFFTFIFYTQHTDADPEKRKLLTLLTVLFLSTATVLKLWYAFYFLCGVGIVLALSIKKRKTAVFLLIASLISIFLCALSENFLSYLSSPKFLYSIKVVRDGYAPPFLIESAIEEKEKRKVELITNELALGELKEAEKLKKLKVENPYLLGISHNNIGYTYFMKGELQKALEEFKKAYEYLKSPIPLFNLYLTYSSLLMLEKANSIKQKLLEENIDISKLSPVPLLIHVEAKESDIEIPYLLFLSLVFGVALGLLADKLSGFHAEHLNTEILQIPGMMSFINSRYKPFIILFAIVLITNLLLGRTICTI